VGGGALGGEARLAPPLYLAGKLPHGLVCRDGATGATGKGRFSGVDSRQQPSAGALARFPQGKRFLYRVLLALEASALDGLADKRLLIECQGHFHPIQR